MSDTKALRQDVKATILIPPIFIRAADGNRAGLRGGSLIK